MSCDSPEKQRVREELWIPAYDRFPGRTLTLPGVACTFERNLVQHGVDLKDIVAVERDEWLVEPILRFLEGKGRLYVGDLTILLEQGKLDSEFGFSVLNLDFYGALYALNAQRRSRILSTIETVIRKQRLAGVDSFSILLTTSVEMRAPESVSSAHGSMGKIIEDEIFEPISALVNQTAVASHFNDLSPSERDVAYSLHATGIHLVDAAHAYHYRAELSKPPMTYVGKGYATRMAAFSVEFHSYSRDGLRPHLANDIIRDEALKKTWAVVSAASWL